MNTIEIDFDVFKQLTLRRATEQVSCNDVLRELLGLPAASPPAADSSRDDWIIKGARFPSGTEFQATHKGKHFTAKVGGGGLILNGQRYGTPSAAAASVTGGTLNGWRFWKCRLPGEQSWQLMESLRR